MTKQIEQMMVHNFRPTNLDPELEADMVDYYLHKSGYTDADLERLSDDQVFRIVNIARVDRRPTIGN